MNVLEKVRSVFNDLRAGKGSAAENWALASRLLSRLTTDSARIQQVISAKDLGGLDALIGTIEGKAAAAEATPAQVFTPEELDHAYRAFHKRLKVSRLADESKLGGRYTSGGRKSNIDAMEPPTEFPAGIWAALVKAGKLKDMGGGFYADPKPPG